MIDGEFLETRPVDLVDPWTSGRHAYHLWDHFKEVSEAINHPLDPSCSFSGAVTYCAKHFLGDKKE